jgi:hypothetical protein
MSLRWIRGFGWLDRLNPPRQYGVPEVPGDQAEQHNPFAPRKLSPYPFVQLTADNVRQMFNRHGP